MNRKRGADPAHLKVSTGIEGFDEISRGGLPHERTTLVAGGPGSGKTIFALQTLIHAAKYENEAGVFVAFEEPSAHILENARSFDWGLDALVRKNGSTPKLAFVDAQISPDVARSGQFDLQGLLAAVGAQARAIGAKRVVFDAVDVLLTLLNDPVLERQELYRLNQWVRANNYSGMITARLSTEDPTTGREFNFLQFMCDCVVMLRHYIADRIALRSVRVVKYRGSNFLANEFPMAFGAQGIVVADIGGRDDIKSVSAERISTGIPRLDQMLMGGFFRGSSILITGAPGTAKTTLAGAFSRRVCDEGGCVLYIAFDENGAEILRNLSSVSINLQESILAGRLYIHSLRTESKSSEEHLIVIRQLLSQYKPDALVVDPISALSRAGGEISPLGAAQRLMHLTKSAGITFLGTSVVDSPDAQSEETHMQISTLADTWMHLTYVVHSGERNRALTIVKSRGTGHSNQVRELVLSDNGVTLSDVYTAGGEVLMGTARWEKEEAARQDHERIRKQVLQKERELALTEAQTRTQIALLERELETRRMELEALRTDQVAREETWAASQAVLRSLRGGQPVKQNGNLRNKTRSTNAKAGNKKNRGK